MNLRLVTALAVFALTPLVTAKASAPRERNYWPFWVGRSADAAEPARWSAGGPLVFGSQDEAGNRLFGVRPLWLDLTAASGATSHNVLYPLWYREQDPARNEQRWTLLNLINSSSGSARDDRFSVWPFYFSRDTGEPDSSYRALFPIYGDISQRFGQTRIQWIGFPLYLRYENNGEVTTSTPWPFIKTVSGSGHSGLEVWPLIGQRQEHGVSVRQFLLWPLLYRSHDKLDTAEPTRRAGFLPFYATESSAGYRSETFGWPFFGYSDRTSPQSYHQTNYFWPLAVQGRGEQRYVNRWAPFYTHSRSPSRTQTWVLWPLWRDRRWTSDHLNHHRQQLLYFVYHAEVQTSRQSPDLASAGKRHVWPLFSHWDNGAGQVQFQAFSPFEVFFPHNDRMRQLWSPLFAVYRYHQSAPGEVRHSWLWDAVTYARTEGGDHREFHLGPLFHYTASPQGTQWGILAGLFKVRRSATGTLTAGSSLTPSSPR